MRSKNIDMNKMVEHKKRIDRHKKDIENKEKIVEKAKTKEITKDKIVDDVTKEKTTDEIAKDETTNDITTGKKKRITRKKPSKEYIDGIKRKAEERAYRIAEGTLSGEEHHEDEPKHEISKEERAERFKRLHEMAVRMTNQWKENNK